MALVSGGSAGATATSCSTVRLTANATGLSTGATVPFNSALVDTDSYFDSVGNRFVIPAGKAGLFIVGFAAEFFNMAGATRVTAVINNSGADINVNETSPIYTNAGDTAASALLQLAVGNVLTARLTFDGGGTADVSKNLSGFWLVKVT
jgi:hypothetical protein